MSGGAAGFLNQQTTTGEGGGHKEKESEYISS